MALATVIHSGARQTPGTAWVEMVMCVPRVNPFGPKRKTASNAADENINNMVRQHSYVVH